MQGTLGLRNENNSSWEVQKWFDKLIEKLLYIPSTMIHEEKQICYK